MECKFNKKRSSSDLEVKISDHIIPQVERFMYLGSIIQNDREIAEDVTQKIQVGWTK